ncbi:kinase-like protein, partial [Athelia psychrophila]
WQKLDHQNIMPCLGVTLDFGLVASLVMPMCPDGSISQYVKENPNANKLDLLSQVAGGIAYLHSRAIVHGKICGRNIVIAPNGRPLITDTGLSQIIQAQEGIFPWGASEVRWMAPELFASELDDACTTSSDVWSLAMTI